MTWHDKAMSVLSVDGMEGDVTVYPKKNSPCRFCRRRSPGCHARCASYSAYDADNKKRRGQIMLANEANGQDATRGRRFWQDMKNGRSGV